MTKESLKDPRTRLYSRDPAGGPQPAPYASWAWIVSAGTTILFLGAVLIAFFWFLRVPLALFFIALTLAAALGPAVAWLTQWMPRGVAILVVYLVLFLLLIGLGWLIIPQLVDQAARFIDLAPDSIDQARSWARRRMDVRDGLFDQLLGQVTTLGSTLVTLPVQLSSSFIDILLVIVMSLYALVAAPKARGFFPSLLPPKRRQKAEDVMRNMAHAMGGYFRGVAITGAIVGSITYVGLLVIGIQFALMLGLIAGIMEFIPMIGPLISGVLIVLVSLLQSPAKALIAIPFALVVQQIENHIISPNVMHPQANISRLATLVVVFAGWSVGGVVGALVSIPLYAAFRVFAIEVLVPAIRRQSRAEPEDDGTAQ